MIDFGISEATRVEFGVDSVDTVGSHARELGAKRVLVVTDAGVVAAGHAGRVVDRLESAGLDVRMFADLHENPTTVDVDACLAAATGFDPDLYVAVGGGSSIDVAKGSMFLAAGGGRMEDYWGVGKARGTLVPLIAIPTTAGTGSEMQSFALIGQEDTHQKMACGDPQAAARLAILDPTLTLTQPRFVTACTGLDCIGHAVETAVTKKRNEISSECSRTAFALANRAFPVVLSDPQDLSARADMLHAAAFAGLAIEHSMLGAAHSMANPLTAHYDNIAHGEAVALSLPSVVEFNGEDRKSRAVYADLARAAGLADAVTPDDEATTILVARLEEFLDLANIRSLTEHGVTKDAIPMLAEEASKQWTAQFNPRAVDVSDFIQLYERAFQQSPR